MRLSGSFSAETQAEFFKAESEMIRFGERAINKKCAKHMRKTLLGIDAVFAVLMSHEIILPAASLIVAYDVASWKYRGDVERCFNASRIDFGFPEGCREEALEALHYMQALEWLSQTITSDFKATPDTIVELHGILTNGIGNNFAADGFRNTYLPHKKGSAPEKIPLEIRELCQFCNADLITPLGQASVIHHAFERIVPFDTLIDRTGLLFAFMPFFRRGLFVDGYVVPICWGAALEREYRKKLKDSSRESPSSRAHVYYRERWAVYNARNTHLAVVIADSFLSKADALRDKWRSQIQKIPANSALDKLLDVFLALPNLTTKHAAGIIGKSYGATNEAMNQLVKAGIVTEASLDNRERLFKCQQSAAMITDFVDELVKMRASVKDSTDLL